MNLKHHFDLFYGESFIMVVMAVLSLKLVLTPMYGNRAQAFYSHLKPQGAGQCSRQKMCSNSRK